MKKLEVLLTNPYLQTIQKHFSYIISLILTNMLQGRLMLFSAYRQESVSLTLLKVLEGLAKHLIR